MIVFVVAVLTAAITFFLSWVVYRARRGDFLNGAFAACLFFFACCLLAKEGGGLHIVRLDADLLDIEMRVDSRRGEGSTFYLILKEPRPQVC